MIAWAAFLLAVLELVFLAAVLAAAARAWSKVAPQITPLLAMFSPPQHPPRCEYRVPGVEGDRCTLSAGHPGSHEWARP